MKIIGLTSLATSGKDFFAKVLIRKLSEQGISAKRYALADKLKEDLRPFLLEKCGIDILACDAEQKKLTRPILVEYGKLKRLQTNGTHWTNYLTEKINAEKPDVAIVSDIRYQFFREDELFWIKNKMGGLLVHISRFDTKNGQKIYVQPPNEEERMNDPIMKANADFKIEWESFDGNEKLAQPFVELFINWAKMNGHI